MTHPDVELNYNTISSNWNDADGKPDGGQTCGMGFTIAWQRGPLNEGRNGAFIIDVLDACIKQMQYYQQGEFRCDENVGVIEHLEHAIDLLKFRRNRRKDSGSLGTHKTDV